MSTQTKQWTSLSLILKILKIKFQKKNQIKLITHKTKQSTNVKSVIKHLRISVLDVKMFNIVRRIVKKMIGKITKNFVTSKKS